MQSTKFNMYYCIYSDEYDILCVCHLHCVGSSSSSSSSSKYPALVTLLVHQGGCRDLGDPNTHYKINTHTWRKEIVTIA